MITLEVESGSGPRRVDLGAYLDNDASERAQETRMPGSRANPAPARGRCAVPQAGSRCAATRLWWFAELYLHKEQAILHVMRDLAAFDALVARDRPLAIRYVDRASSRASSRRPRRAQDSLRRTGMAGALVRRSRADGRPARGAAAGARLSRLRRGAGARRVARDRRGSCTRPSGARTSRTAAPSLHSGRSSSTRDRRRGGRPSATVGIGARTNFRARRWWDSIVARDESAVMPIERFARRRPLAPSRRVYRRSASRPQEPVGERRASRARRDSRLRLLAVVRQQLGGIALLQFPWSARSMDERRRALGAIEPEVAVTYAEAGGLGTSAGARMPPARDTAGPACKTWIHLPATG